MTEHQQSRCLLHSARHEPRWATKSIHGNATSAWRVWADHDASLHAQHLDARGNTLETIPISDPFEPLRWARQSGDLWIGYVGYEAGRYLEATPDPTRDHLHWPLLQIQRVPDPTTCPPGLNPENLKPQQAPWLLAKPEPDITPDQYKTRVATIINAIHQGDLFQTNFTYQLHAAFSGSTRAFYHDLIQHAPAWYGSYIELITAPDEPQRTLASVSPELFLEAHDNQITTRPIKGTANPTQKHELHHSEKDAAELNMIVDVLRNDLGRSATLGSVRVQQGRSIEHHTTVAHGVATIQAALRPDANWVDALRLASPGGSITGAPKIQAMKLIDQLEATWRGPYCGSIGYLKGDHACWNIAIRTAAITQNPHNATGTLHYGVGGGIVADSQPDSEWIETQIKSKPILNAIQYHTPQPSPQTISTANSV